MANSVDQDQLASSEANWSGSQLFAKAGYIQVQQDQRKLFLCSSKFRVYDVCKSLLSLLVAVNKLKLYITARNITMVFFYVCINL